MIAWKDTFVERNELALGDVGDGEGNQHCNQSHVHPDQEVHQPSRLVGLRDFL
jgi:hypothetical protein